MEDDKSNSAKMLGIVMLGTIAFWTAFGVYMWVL
jgi:hypothetical protein